MLAHPKRVSATPGSGAGEVLEYGRECGLLSAGDAEHLAVAYRLLGDLLQWQRLMIEGSFDADTVPRAVLKRFATVPGRRA
jgi:[glutamine synthetase] adenylyltransferase / [glutamine synthetase]-adenylyl-L-tyrosine phosphorylase